MKQFIVFKITRWLRRGKELERGKKQKVNKEALRIDQEMMVPVMIVKIKN